MSDWRHADARISIMKTFAISVRCQTPDSQMPDVVSRRRFRFFFYSKKKKLLGVDFIYVSLFEVSKLQINIPKLYPLNYLYQAVCDRKVKSILTTHNSPITDH